MTTLGKKGSSRVSSRFQLKKGEGVVSKGGLRGARGERKARTVKLRKKGLRGR